MILRKSFYIRWSAGRSPRVHEVNPGRDPSFKVGKDSERLSLGWGQPREKTSPRQLENSLPSKKSRGSWG